VHVCACVCVCVVYIEDTLKLCEDGRMHKGLVREIYGEKLWAISTST